MIVLAAGQFTFVAWNLEVNRNDDDNCIFEASSLKFLNFLCWCSLLVGMG